MGQSKKLKNLRSIFKDKAKIIKTAFYITNRTTTSIQIAVLRATTRSAHSPPPNHHISALLSLGHTTRHSAAACTSAIIHRLHHHHEPNAYVALKSLITLHQMIAFVLNDHLSFRPPSTADFGFLNLSRFVDNTDAQSLEFSLWAQWYARFLESNLSTSTVLGCLLTSSNLEIDKKKEKLKISLYMDLFQEIEALVSMIEEICRAPKSLHCQTNDIVYEVMRLVGEDYRMTQYHTMIRLNELSTRIQRFSTSELNQLSGCLGRLEGCKERLTEMFMNRRRNQSFWDSVAELMAKLNKRLKEMESVSRRMIEYTTESTQLKKQLRPASRPLRLSSFGKGNNWLNVGRVNLTVSMASA